MANIGDVDATATNGARLLAFFVSGLLMIFVAPLYGAMALAVFLVFISLLEGRLADHGQQSRI